MTPLHGQFDGPHSDPLGDGYRRPLRRLSRTNSSISWMISSRSRESIRLSGKLLRVNERTPRISFDRWAALARRDSSPAYDPGPFANAARQPFARIRVHLMPCFVYLAIVPPHPRTSSSGCAAITKIRLFFILIYLLCCFPKRYSARVISLGPLMSTASSASTGKARVRGRQERLRLQKFLDFRNGMSTIVAVRLGEGLAREFICLREEGPEPASVSNQGPLGWMFQGRHTQ